jgi:hypothetical protein
MTRVVYLVCSHSNPDQVLRLVKLLRKGSGTSRVVIHHDEAVSHLDPASLVGLDGVHLLEPMPIEWGTFSLLRCSCPRLGKASARRVDEILAGTS